MDGFGVGGGVDGFGGGADSLAGFGGAAGSVAGFGGTADSLAGFAAYAATFGGARRIIVFSKSSPPPAWPAAGSATYLSLYLPISITSLF